MPFSAYFPVSKRELLGLSFIVLLIAILVKDTLSPAKYVTPHIWREYQAFSKDHTRELLSMEAEQAGGPWFASFSAISSSVKQYLALGGVLFLAAILAVIKTVQTKQGRACKAAELRVFVRNFGSVLLGDNEYRNMFDACKQQLPE